MNPILVLNTYYYRGRRTQQCAHDTWRIGNCHPCPSLDFDTVCDVNTVMKFYRIEIRNSLYYSKEYKHSSKSNNNTVTFETLVNKDNFAVIKFFVELQHPVNHNITELNTEIFTACSTPPQSAIKQNPQYTGGINKKEVCPHPQLLFWVTWWCSG